MKEPRSASSGAPALVACLCAVATVLALGSYLHLRGQLDEAERRQTESEARLERLEAERATLALAVDDLRRRADELRRASEAEAAPPAVWPVAAEVSASTPGSFGGQGGEANAEVPALGGASEGGEDAGASTALRELPPAEPGGRVLVVSERRAAVMVDRGSRDGLRMNEILAVYRNGRFIGEIAVTQEPFYGMAVCGLVSAVDLRVGDRVRREQ